MKSIPKYPRLKPHFEALFSAQTANQQAHALSTILLDYISILQDNPPTHPANLKLLKDTSKILREHEHLLPENSRKPQNLMIG